MWYHIQIAIFVYVENIFILVKFARSLNATQWSAVQFNQACRILIRIMLCSRINLHATKSSEMKDCPASLFVDQSKCRFIKLSTYSHWVPKLSNALQCKQIMSSSLFWQFDFDRKQHYHFGWKFWTSWVKKVEITALKEANLAEITRSNYFIKNFLFDTLLKRMRT